MSEQPTLDLYTVFEQPLAWPEHRPILAPFDEGRLCPKCGNLGVGVTYHEIPSTHGPCHALRDVPMNRWGEIGEHLDRSCQRCRYGWAESCVSTTALTVESDPEQNGD